MGKRIYELGKPFAGQSAPDLSNLYVEADRSTYGESIGVLITQIMASTIAIFEASSNWTTVVAKVQNLNSSGIIQTEYLYDEDFTETQNTLNHTFNDAILALQNAINPLGTDKVYDSNLGQTQDLINTDLYDILGDIFGKTINLTALGILNTNYVYDVALGVNQNVINAETASHEGRITSVEASVIDHEGRIGINEFDIADHESRITSNTSTSSQNETDITTLQNKAQNLDETGQLASSAVYDSNLTQFQEVLNANFSTEIKKNSEFLTRMLANGFIHEFSMEVYEDSGTVYAEIWPNVEAWDSGTSYVKYNSVYDNGKKYTAIRQSTNKAPASNPSYWHYDEEWDGNLYGYMDGTDRVYSLDCVTGSGRNGRARVALTTSSTANSPLLNIIYAIPDTDPDSSSTVLNLTAGTSLPLGGVIFVGYAGVWTLSEMQSGVWALPQQLFNNTVYKDTLEKSLIGTIREKLRRQGITHATGVACSCEITQSAIAKDSVHVDNTTGLIYQLWPEYVPSNLRTNGYLVLNSYNVADPNNPKLRFISDINEITVLADGSPVSHNKCFGLEIFGISTSGENSPDMLGILLPNGSYSDEDDAINDVNNLTVTTVPDSFYITSYRVCRIVLKYLTTAGGTYTNLLTGSAVQDRRKWPIGTYGGGSGSSITVSYSIGTNDLASGSTLECSLYGKFGKVCGTTQQFTLNDLLTTMPSIELTMTGGSINTSELFVGETLILESGDLADYDNTKRNTLKVRRTPSYAGIAGGLIGEFTVTDL